MEDQSILNSTNRKGETYLDDLAFAVCVNGESLEKYKKIVEKKYGTDVYSKMVQFASTIDQHSKRRQFTNTSLLSLKFLGKNAGLSEMAINMIVEHLRDQFQGEQLKEERRKHEDSAFWNQCSPNSIPQLQEYLRKYPNGMYVTRAKSLIANLERIEKEAVEESRMYNQCRTRIDYMDYLRKYPNGLHKSRAQAKIKEFDKVAAQERAAYVQEKNTYEQCKTKDDYLQYISLYPNGMYVNQARNRIESINKRTKEFFNNLGNGKVRPREGGRTINDSNSKVTSGNNAKKTSRKGLFVLLMSAIILYVIAYFIREEYENLGPFLCLISYFPYMLFAFEVVKNKKFGMIICITGWFVMIFCWSDYIMHPAQSILPALGILCLCAFLAVVAYLLMYREET